MDEFVCCSTSFVGTCVALVQSSAEDAPVRLSLYSCDAASEADMGFGKRGFVRESEGRKSLTGVQGQSPVGGLGNK